MLFNLSFEIVALMMLLLVMRHVGLEHGLRTANAQHFFLLAMLGVFNILLDIGSTTLSYYPNIYPVWLQSIMMHIFYATQLMMPFILYLYVLTLRNYLHRTNTLYILFSALPLLFMSVVLLMNPITGIMFYYNEAGCYCHGMWYMATYLHALFYIVISTVSAIRYRREISADGQRVVLESGVICFTAVVLQMYFSNVLLTGVGIAASLIVLLLTVNNPQHSIDSLTGLFDMAGLRATLEEYYAKKTPFSAMVIALDDLKRINLVFGMDHGNKLLQDVAAELAASCGRENVFRFIGDRFVVLFRNAEDYARFVGNVRTRNTLRTIGTVEVNVTACYSAIPDANAFTDSHDFMDYLDYVTDLCKQKGSGSLLETDEDTVATYVRMQEISAYLYTAIQNDLFEVYYQPVYCLVEKRFTGAEALARLCHPTLGMISPAEFIPIAEHSGDVDRVDMCILRKVCRMLHENPQVGHALHSVKVNVSSASFLNAHLSETIQNILRESGVPPQLLHFEVTETAATVYEKEVTEWAKNMRQNGSRLCLDDFGSGYANLDSVLRLPFSVVKMDRSLLLAATANHDAETLYRSVVATMQALGMEIVAEGAETTADVTFLESIGVECVQGFYFAKPLPEAEFLAQLA